MSHSDQILTDLLSNESFVRWIKGKASQPERHRWELWMQEDSQNRDLKRKAEMLYQLPLEASGYFEDNDLETQLKRLNERIDKDEADRKYKPDLNIKQGRRKNWGYRLTAAAAVTLLAVLVSVLSMHQPTQPVADEDGQPQFTTFEVEYGERGALKISDGTRIQLNSNSSLRYNPQQFNTDLVEVWLQGEGYFNIKHNPNGQERAFIVHTPDGDVQVLGTKFNVSTRFQETSVVLEEGSVKVLLPDSTLNKPIETIMEPGEQLLFSASSKGFERRQVDVHMVTAWLHGRMEFSETSLKIFIASIEAMYNVSLDVEQPSLLNKQITGAIQNPNLQTLLTGLEKILNLKIIERSEGQYLITKQSIQKEKP